MKRIALFVLTNLAIMVVLGITLSIISSVFGIRFNFGGQSLNIGALMVFSLVVGFTGAFISLLLSKPMAKWSTGARVITQPANAMEQWLVDTVRAHAQKAGIGMPEVALYEGEPNAFATGAFKNSALVAVSTGLLQSMSRGRARPRGRARGQRRYGHDDADSGRDEHVRRIPVARDRLRGRPHHPAQPG
jgi:heat shock protein HtpX